MFMFSPESTPFAKKEPINNQEVSPGGVLKETKGGNKIETFEESKDLNDKFLVLKRQLEEIKQKERELLQDEEGNYAFPDDVQFNEKGELVNITVNGIKKGYGKLGKLLKDNAPVNDHREVINDTYIIEAYNNNSQVKEILDSYFDLRKEEDGLLKEVKEIREKKKEIYQKVSEVKKLLQAVGFERELDTSLNLDELKDKLQSDENFKAALKQWNELLESLKDIELSDELSERYKIDFKALSDVLREVQEIVEARRMRQGDFEGDFFDDKNNYISQDAIKAYNQIAETGDWRNSY